MYERVFHIPHVVFFSIIISLSLSPCIVEEDDDQVVTPGSGSVQETISAQKLLGIKCIKPLYKNYLMGLYQECLVNPRCRFVTSSRWTSF
jgi:hypothetical protein